MAAIKLTYFDFDGSRGDECRLALHVAGLDFEDDRISDGWSELKPRTPFRSLPVLQVEGHGVLGQSNAILTWIGRTHDLHPPDAWEAARHEALMCFCEELRERLEPSIEINDPAEKKRVREELAGGYLQTWGACVEAQLGDGPFVGGERLNVADLKLFIIIRWFARGVLDHIPADVFEAYPKVMRLYEAVGAHPGVQSWYALRAQKRAASSR